MKLVKQKSLKKENKIDKVEEDQISNYQNRSKAIQDKFVQINQMVTPKFICKCLMCANNVTPCVKQKKINNFFKLRRAQTRNMTKKIHMKTLLEFLLPRKKRKGLKLLIPEVCFYQNHLPECIFMTGKDDIKIIKPNKMTKRQVLNTFLEQKKLYKFGIIENFQRDIMSHVGFDKEMHEKYVESVLPSHKCGGSFIHKGFHSFKIHKDNNLTMHPLQAHKSKINQQICIVRYLHGNDTLLNETEFKEIMKEKTKRILPQILTIQSFIKPKKESQSILQSSYKYYSKIENLELFQKAEKEVDILLEIIPKISQQYITQQTLYEYNNDLKAKPQEYVLYQTYKIVHYLNKCCDIKTEKLKLIWVINEIDLFYMVDIHEFEFEKLDYDIDRKFTKYEFEKAKMEIKQQDGLEKWLYNQWQEAKRQSNIKTEKKKNDSEETRTSQVLNIFNPTSDFDKLISDDPLDKTMLKIITSTSMSSSRPTSRYRTRTTSKSKQKTFSNYHYE